MTNTSTGAEPSKWQMHGAWHQRDMSSYLLDILRNERASISPFRDRVDLDIADVFPEEEQIDPVDEAIEIVSKDEQARRNAVIARQERELAAFLDGYDRRGRETKRRYYAHSPGSEARAEEAEALARRGGATLSEPLRQEFSITLTSLGAEIAKTLNMKLLQVGAS